MAKRTSQPKSKTLEAPKQTPELLQPSADQSKTLEAPKQTPEPKKPAAKAEASGSGSYTKPGFVPENPDQYAHLVIEQPDYDNRTGEKKSVHYPQSYNQGDLAQFAEYGIRFGYVVREILHMPAGWDDSGIKKMIEPFK